MVEFIGAAAAIPQLAKYGLSAINTIPDFYRRFQRAPNTLHQWHDDVSLLVSLAKSYRLQPNLVGQVPVDIIDRFSESAEELALQFEKLTVIPADGSFSRLKKNLGIIRKEREINHALVSIVQRSTLISSHLLNAPVISTTVKGPRSHLESSNTHASTLSTTRTSSEVPSTTMTRANSGFIGQKDLLEHLSRSMEQAISRCVIVAGPSGIGKSCLAREFVSPPRKPPDTTVLWVDASTADTIPTSVNVSIRHTLLPEGGSINWKTPSEIIVFLESVVMHEWILVLDNANGHSVEVEGFKEQLSRSTKGRVLITTRNRRFAFSMVQASDIVDMPAMNSNDAKQLLDASSVRMLGNEHSGDADLVQYLGYHPSAILQAARYMNTNYLSSSELVASLENGTIPLPAVLGLDSTTIANPGSLALDLEQSTTGTIIARYLSLLSCLDHSHLSSELLSRVACTSEEKHAVSLMKSYYMLRPASLQSFLQLDSLIAKLVIAVFPKRADRCQIVVSALDIVAQLLMHSTDGRQHQSTGQDFAHALCVLHALIRFTAETEVLPATVATAVVVATGVCRHLVLAGRASEAIGIIEQLFLWGQNTISSFHQASNRLYSKLGAAYQSVGLLERAFVVTRSALYAQCQLNENHVDTLHSLNNMGVLYQDQGLFTKAEKYHSKALELKQEIFGSQHEETYITLNNLALSLQSQGRLMEAEKMHRRTLRGRKRLLDPTHPDIYTSLSNFGVLLYSQGRLQEARECHEAALAGRETTLGFSHLETLKSKANLALVLGQLGGYDGAILMFHEVCQYLKQTVGVSHLETINSFRNTAIFLYRQGRFRDAETLMKEALSGLEERYGKGNEKTFGAHQYIAALLHLQGQLEEAYDVAAWLFEMRCEVLGDTHPDTICSREHVVELEREMDNAGT